MQSLDQHVTKAGNLGDNLLLSGQTIDAKLQPLRTNDEGGVKGLLCFNFRLLDFAVGNV